MAADAGRARLVFLMTIGPARLHFAFGGIASMSAVEAILRMWALHLMLTLIYASPVLSKLYGTFANHDASQNEDP